MTRIFLCSFNGERFIEEQVRSILAQETEEPFSILASDDGSTDGTLSILRALQREVGEEKLRIMEQIPPTGSPWQHFLRLFAEEYWQGADYVMLSDQDDVWEKNKLEKCLQEMQRLESTQGSFSEEGRSLPLLVHCDSKVVDEARREIAPSFREFQKMTPSRCKLSQLLVQNNVVGGAMMINAALCRRIRKVPEHAVMHDQWIALIASAFGKISYVPEALYDYRQHGGNTLGAEKGSRILEVLQRLGLFRKDGKSKEEMDAHSRRVYRDLFLQAESFLSIYGAQLSAENRSLVQQFAALPKRSRLGKCYTILRYGFTYNLLHRTIGEMLFL